MAHIELTCKTRDVLGKKVAALRRRGIIPVHLFGHGVNSLALECEAAHLQHVLSQSGGTRLIDLKVDKTKQSKKVLVREVQRNPVKGNVLHVDFYQVRMEEKVRLEIPIVLVGEAPALKNKGTVLSHEMTSLNIECLPDAIPNTIEVDLSTLAEEGDAIYVRDITAAAGITVTDHPDQLVARVNAPRVVEEPEAEVVAEEAVVEATEREREAGTEKDEAG